MNQASIFTLEKDAKGYKDFEEFPQHIYVDSSAWICAYGSHNQSSLIANGSQRRGRDIADFMKECVANDVSLYHSKLILSEVIHANKKAHLDYIIETNEIQIPRYKSGSVNYKQLNENIFNDHLDLKVRIENSQKDILKFIDKTSIFLPYEEDEESVQDMLQVIDSTGGLLDTQDATHVCIARSYGINSFLTADGDFIYLDNDNVFTISTEKYNKKKLGRSNILLDFDGNQY